MNEIIILKRETTSDKPNVNGYTYSKKTFEAAMGEAMKNHVPVCLAPLNDLQYQMYAADRTCLYSIGRVIDYNDETFTVFLDGKNEDIVKDYVMKNKNKIKVLMKYECEVDKHQIREMSMRILSFDIKILPEIYFN